ncbi:DUF3953 domain-containing protein [Halobacillus shinanisalinarum]|uniref:DUF3953 domain-containing protein n=1 Tax=Halobacillus shinanisalinarum TaxID=2932258 RepID=A0ABY4GWZ3_9BACI|nr:DUF3953 domain-containing protein [Halobacillus shinanisalinarum]UOQ92240.1 DUF3953 domain-containing protein [Halobacillus shinanisalinarum]
MKISKFALSVIIILLSAYMLITKNFDMLPLSNFLLGLFMLVMGVEEFRKGRKGYGYLGVAVSLFAFFVSLQSIFLS